MKAVVRRDAQRPGQFLTAEDLHGLPRRGGQVAAGSEGRAQRIRVGHKKMVFLKGVKPEQSFHEADIGHLAAIDRAAFQKGMQCAENAFAHAALPPEIPY